MQRSGQLWDLREWRPLVRGRVVYVVYRKCGRSVGRHGGVEKAVAGRRLCDGGSSHERQGGRAVGPRSAFEARRGQQEARWAVWQRAAKRMAEDLATLP